MTTTKPAAKPVEAQVEEALAPRPAAVLLGEVMAEVGAIAKGERNAAQGFNFRGIDTVLNALYPHLASRGLWISPEVLDERFEQRTNDKGKTANVSFLKVRFVFNGPAGDQAIIGPVWGEGSDFADKATGKAHSMAMKTAIIEAFSIPTQDTPDADRDVAPDTELGDSLAPRATVETLLREHGRSWEQLADIMHELYPDADTSVQALKAVNRANQVQAIRQALEDHTQGPPA